MNARKIFKSALRDIKDDKYDDAVGQLLVDIAKIDDEALDELLADLGGPQALKPGRVVAALHAVLATIPGTAVVNKSMLSRVDCVSQPWQLLIRLR